MVGQRVGDACSPDKVGSSRSRPRRGSGVAVWWGAGFTEESVGRRPPPHSHTGAPLRATSRRAHLVGTTSGSDSLFHHLITLRSTTHHFTYCADRHVLTSMVCYVILRRFLREIPSWISFRDPRVSAWLTPGGEDIYVASPPQIWQPGAPEYYQRTCLPTFLRRRE